MSRLSSLFSRFQHFDLLHQSLSDDLKIRQDGWYVRDDQGLALFGLNTQKDLKQQQQRRQQQPKQQQHQKLSPQLNSCFPMKTLVENISIKRFFDWLSKAFESYIVILATWTNILSFQPIRSKGETNWGNQFTSARFPTLIISSIFSRAGQCFHALSRLATFATFPALRSVWMLFVAWQRLHVFPRLALISCFPALRFGCIFWLEFWLPFGIIHFCCVFIGGGGVFGVGVGVRVGVSYKSEGEFVEFWKTIYFKQSIFIVNF